MSQDFLAQHLQDPEALRRFQQDRLLIETASLIDRTMRQRGMTRKQLAEAIGVTKARVTHYLGGQSNLTLRTIADIFAALNARVRIQTHPLEPVSGGWEEIPGLAARFQLPESWFRPSASVDSEDASNSSFDLAS